jgi:hypothetical protein
MLSWTEFEKLPGSAQRNFETLCRALIELHYPRHGPFAALANQPGVEFHLLLHTNCALGIPGQWFGWQCRWYDLPSGKALGNTWCGPCGVNANSRMNKLNARGLVATLPVSRTLISSPFIASSYCKSNK